MYVSRTVVGPRQTQTTAYRECEGKKSSEEKRASPKTWTFVFSTGKVLKQGFYTADSRGRWWSATYIHRCGLVQSLACIRKVSFLVFLKLTCDIKIMIHTCHMLLSKINIEYSATMSYNNVIKQFYVRPRAATGKKRGSFLLIPTGIYLASIL